MNGWQIIETIGLVKRLYDEYESNPTAVACDLLATIARVATLHRVPLQPMLDAVKRGARVG